MVTMRWVALAVGLALAGHPAPAQDAATELFVEALTGARDGTDPLVTRRLLSAVAEEYPESPQARAIASGRIPGLDLGALPAGPDWHTLVVPGGALGGYRHGQYPSEGDATHPGLDIGGGCGLPVLAPVGGEVVHVVSAEVTDADLAAMGTDRVRNDHDLERNTGNAAVLRHDGGSGPVYTIYLHMEAAPALADGTRLAPGMTVARGAEIGRTGDTGFAQGCHVHFEARTFAGLHGYLHPTYGQVYPPGDVSGTASFAADWIDPEAFLRRAFVAGRADSAPAPQAAAAPGPPSEWGPGIVPNVDLTRTCPAPRNADPACLREIGYPEDAIAFAFGLDGDYSGTSAGIDFMDLGAVDLGVVRRIGPNVEYFPVLLNGPFGIARIPRASDLPLAFADETSLRILRRHPAAQAGFAQIMAHRVLPDGTQRFVLSEVLSDGCPSCPFLGYTVEFLDFGPATANVLMRRAVGLTDEPGALSPGPGMDMDDPRTLQTLLNRLGYLAGEMDGYPGPQTRQGLMEFQAEHCLTPTGQPDAATATSLFGADGFAVPCAGAALPPGISANTPLLRGTYVSNPAYCATDSIPYEVVHLALRTVRERDILFGLEGSCETARTDIRDGVTLFRGQCQDAGSGPYEGRWRFDILSNDAFIDLDIDGRGTSARFERCPESGSPEVAAAPSAGPFTPVGKTADLFNAFAHILFGNCDAGCAYSGYTAPFRISELAPADLPRPSRLSGGCEMLYGQAVPGCHPTGLRPGDLGPEHRFFRVAYEGCDAPGCPAGLFAINWPSRGIAAGDPAFSGEGGFAYDYVLTATPAPAAPAPAAPPPAPAEMLDLTALTGLEIAGLLRAHGVAEGNTFPVVPNDRQAAAEAEIVAHTARFRAASPLVLGPEMPFDAGFDAAGGKLILCSARDIGFVASRLIGGNDSPPAMIFLPKDPLTGFGSLPRLCARSNWGAVDRIEAEYGTGTFHAFGIGPAGGLSLELAADAATGARIAAAAAEGRARARFECRMVYRAHNPPTPSPYDHDRIGTCQIERMHIALHDHAGGTVERIVYDASGQLWAPLGALTAETTAETAAPAPAIERAAWTFETRDSGAEVVRRLVEGLAGQPVEIVLGYRNAFPFKTERAKQLAVDLFRNLPEGETDTVAGTEAGYGSFILKAWSDLNAYYFADEPAPGYARAVIGRAEDVRVLSVTEQIGSSCEWQVTYRLWLGEKTPFGAALEAARPSDGLTFKACFRTTRTGYEIAEYDFLD